MRCLCAVVITARRFACMLLFLSLALAAQDPGTGKVPSSDQAPDRPHSAAGWQSAEEGPGLAAKYPSDQGIHSHPAVLYATGFEQGIRGGLKKRRHGVQVLTNTKLARSGKACAQITATRGQDTGGDLLYEWTRGVTRCYVRFYCRFERDSVTPHHFVTMGGHTPTYKYRFGGSAGMRPPGGEHGKFSTTVEPPNLDLAPKHRKGWMFYTYWHEMRSWQTPHGASEGRPNPYYGNSFLADQQRPFLGREQWICVEFMVQLNQIGKHDGEQALWIDGKKVGHWGKGFPVGSWIRDRFVTSGNWNKDPQPFRGFRWRADKRLKINRAMLQWYVSKRSAKNGRADQNIVYFDNFVIATKYIGPTPDASPPRRR